MDSITMRILSAETVEDLARDCIARNITAAQRIEEEFDDIVAEGFAREDICDDDDVEGAIAETILDITAGREGRWMKKV